MVVHDPGNEDGREEGAELARDEGRDIGDVGRVGSQANGPVDACEDGEEEEGGGSDQHRKYAGKDHGDGEERPAHVLS